MSGSDPVCGKWSQHGGMLSFIFLRFSYQLRTSLVSRWAFSPSHAPLMATLQRGKCGRVGEESCVTSHSQRWRHRSIWFPQQSTEIILSLFYLTYTFINPPLHPFWLIMKDCSFFNRRPSFSLFILSILFSLKLDSVNDSPLFFLSFPISFVSSSAQFINMLKLPDQKIKKIKR